MTDGGGRADPPSRRVEYIRRRLAADTATSRAHVSTQDLRKFADRFADLADQEVMHTAWR